MKSKVITYNFGEHNFDAVPTALAIKPPANYTHGELIDIGVAVTKTFTATTTPAYIRIGTTTDADKYAELNMGVAANTNYYNTLDDADAINTSTIPSQTQLEIALIPCTGGTPAGKGFVSIIIEWFS